VVNAVDWLGFDGYPYFQNTMANSISDAKSLFDEAVGKTQSVANGKEVWITETGWPISGDQENLATASVENAKKFWDEVGCPLFDNVNTWWYILQDGEGSSVPNPSFGLVGNTLSTKPLFDLSCSASHSSSSASGSSSSTSTSTSSTRTAVVLHPTGGAGGSDLGSSDSFPSSGSGHNVGGGSISVIPSPSSSATPTPSSGSGSGSGTGSGSGSGSGTGTSDESTSSTSPDPADFTGAGTRLSGSIFGAAIAVAALAIAL
jgi:glucan endo-1,3-beta-D-glucosidase